MCRTRLTVMRIARLLSMLLAVLAAVLVMAPGAAAEPPFRLATQVTDNAGVLSGAQLDDVRRAVDKLYDDQRIQLWVVYVRDFAGQSALSWAQNTMSVSDFGDDDALLAIATEDRAFAFQVPNTITGGSSTLADNVRRNDIEPALHRGDWSGAAVAAANGLNVDTGSGTEVSWLAVVIVLAVVLLLVVLLWLWLRRRRRKRREAEFAAAKRVDPTDPNALASVPIDALDDLSKSIIVDVDNAVRTSEGELALAVEEFGQPQTEPFSRAVTNAKTALAQAFNVRQILDDAIPEAPLQRRDLLTRVVVSAAKADRELDSQSEAFEQLRDLVINAPTRLDALTQQMVDLTARMVPSAHALEDLHKQYDAAALSAVAGNVDTAKERLAFADRNISTARNLVSRPAGDQTSLVDAIRAAESALGQARTLLDAVDSAATDINRAVAGLPAAITDIQNGIDQAGALLQQGNTPQAAELSAARDAAAKAAAAAKSNGNADPLGTFTRLTKADADLDRLLASVHEQREAAERLSRSLDQSMFTAQSRIKAVSDFIDTRRGSIGPEARTRLAEASRQLEAAEAKRSSNPTEAIAHANGAAMLAAQAQSLANDDVRAAQRSYSSQYGGGSDMGAVIGGIIIGNILRGGFSGGWGGGYGGGWGGGRSMGRPTSYGGSSRSSGRSYSGGSGRF
jgi:predicted  nucleic acid-binding Zn-ribbon protein